MIGQGVYVQSSSPPRAPASPPLDPCTSTSSEVLAFCSSFNTATTSTTAPQAPAPPPPSELRRLALKAPHPTHILKCPRCASLDTKFCYYNNYSLSQPRYFCKNCKRYWTAGGVLRNVPVGGGLRKNKRSKLKLAAEAEAAAAARESFAQQQHGEGKPPSPVRVASACAIGSSDTTANSSVVSGVPTNYVGAPTSYLPSHNPTATHLPRTSSESEGSAIDSSGINESCTASAGSAVAFFTEQQPSCGQFQSFYGGAGVVHVGRPLYYASNTSTTVGLSCNEQYSVTSGDRSRSFSYHAVGYAGSCTDQNMGNLTSVEQVVGSNGDDSVVVGKGIEGGSDDSGNHASMKDSSDSSYDWQFMSENLFNGSGTEGFLPMSEGSWPDFSHFHDPTGPG